MLSSSVSVLVARSASSCELPSDTMMILESVVLTETPALPIRLVRSATALPASVRLSVSVVLTVLASIVLLKVRVKFFEIEL